MILLTDVTVVIIAKDEEDHIGDCLDSCSAFPNRWVIDTGSTDGTVAISDARGATIIQEPFTNFRDIRAVALERVETPWILFLDADERLSPDVAQWIQETMPADWDGVCLPRRNYLLGGWVRYSGWGDDAPLRLARVACSRMSDQRVHESIQVHGAVGRLEAIHPVHIVHFTCQDLASYFLKINHYTSIEAKDRYLDPAFKTTPVAIVSRSFGMFTQTLFHFKGRKDGARGLIIAVLNMVYSLLLMIKIWEQRNTNG